MGQKKVSSNEPKTMQHPLKHQNKPFQTTFQSTKVIRDHSRGFRNRMTRWFSIWFIRIVIAKQNCMIFIETPSSAGLQITKLILVVNLIDLSVETTG